jgi:NDP-sugar pyrophosphorylase family protein
MGVPLVDHAIARVAPVAERVAVNVHHGREAMERHLAGRVHVSVEEVAGLGTAGGVGHLGPWVDGADLLVVNGDTWCPEDLSPVVAGWDHERVRVVISGQPGPSELGPRSEIVASLMPWSVVRTLAAAPSGLYEVCWAPSRARGALDVVGHPGLFVDCATPADYLRANLAASGGSSVVGTRAVIDPRLIRSVVWEGATVHPGEELVDAIRTDDGLTVLVR